MEIIIITTIITMTIISLKGLKLLRSGKRKI
jgi:hypothetical protein